MAQVQFVDGHGERGEGTGAGRVDHAVGAAQIKAVGDAPGHHIAQQAGEGVFLPRHVGIRDAVTDFSRLRLVHTGFPKRLHPDAALQAAGHIEEELLAGGDAQDDAGALPVNLAELVLHRVIQHLAGGDQSEQLAGIGGGDGGGLHTEFDRVEVDVTQERSPLTVGLVVGPGVGIVMIGQQPAGLRDVGDEIAAGKNIAPEAVSVGGARKDGAHTGYGDGFEVRGHRSPSGKWNCARCCLTPAFVENAGGVVKELGGNVHAESTKLVGTDDGSRPVHHI